MPVPVLVSDYASNNKAMVLVTDYTSNNKSTAATPAATAGTAGPNNGSGGETNVKSSTAVGGLPVVRVLRMNDAKNLNTFRPQLTQSLRRALAQAESDQRVHVVVLTGSGKVFSAGGDMNMMLDPASPSSASSAPDPDPSKPSSAMSPVDLQQFIEQEFAGLVQLIGSMSKPVIAAVNGVAMGVGFFTALSCDLIVASRNASFGSAYVRIGLCPLGLSFLLPRLVGYARAFELLALSPVLSAQQAADLGLINRVVDDRPRRRHHVHGDDRDRAYEDARRRGVIMSDRDVGDASDLTGDGCAEGAVVSEAVALGFQLCGLSTHALRHSKRLMRLSASGSQSLDDHLALGAAVQPLLLRTPQHQRAVRSFLHRGRGSASGSDGSRALRAPTRHSVVSSPSPLSLNQISIAAPPSDPLLSRL